MRPPKDQPFFDRAPPVDIEAEISVLGSVLLLPKVIDDVAHIVSREDFHDDAHGRLFGHFLAMREAGKGIDPTTLVDRLRAQGEYEATGGAGYIGKLLDQVPTAAHAIYYAEIVRNKTLLRRLITAATEILRDAYAPCDNPGELLGKAEATITAIAGGSSASGDARLIGDVAKDAVAELRRSLESPVRPGVMSGLLPLDSGMGPIMPGELFVLAARPGQGKTALAMQFAEQVSARARSVLFVSLEMKDRELVRRELSRLAGLDSRNVRSLQISETDLSALEDCTAHFEGKRIWLWDKPSSTVGQIRNLARQINSRERLDLVIVDYLQLVEPAQHERDVKRYEFIGRVTRGLKNLAKEIDAPVIALSQMNREGDGQRPRLSMLRESGNIEQDADTVVFIYHDEEKARGKQAHEAREAELIVAKHRHSDVGSVGVFWTPAEVRFTGEVQWTGN